MLPTFISNFKSPEQQKSGVSPKCRRKYKHYLISNLVRITKAFGGMVRITDM